MSFNAEMTSQTLTQFILKMMMKLIEQHPLLPGLGKGFLEIGTFWIFWRQIIEQNDIQHNCKKFEGSAQRQSV
jgi:lipoate-protein ligase A